MIGQAVSNGQKFNVVILAGGAGTRMGAQSDFMPKALSVLGQKRAIDYIIERYLFVAHKFIIGTCAHAELLEGYVRGRFPQTAIEFSREAALVNNAVSTMYCLDHADTAYPTIICFCDLLILSNALVRPDTVFVASARTQGNVGTFRHAYNPITQLIQEYDIPQRVDQLGVYGGVLGTFVLEDTRLLKRYAYDTPLTDLTASIIMPYWKGRTLRFEEVHKVFEFGSDNDLAKVRELWEKTS